MNEWLAKIRRAFGGLAPRERMLVSVATSLLAVALGYAMVVTPILAAVERGGQRRELADLDIREKPRMPRQY